MLGAKLYHWVTSLEAFFYGLKECDRRVGDHRLSWYDSDPEGSEKPVLLLLHGFSADKSLWLRFARHFTNDFRVLIPDLPGHGTSSYNAKSGYAMDDYMATLIDWLDHLSADTVSIVGNSMGGQLAAHIAVNHPQRVRAIVLMDPAGLKGTQASEHDTLLANGENVFLMRDENDFARFYPMTMTKAPYMPGMVLKAMAHSYCRRRAQLAHLFEDFMASSTPGDGFAQTSVPCLLIWGAQDKLVDVSAADTWSELRPDMDVMIWDDIGHMPMLEAPRRSAREVKDFLTARVLQ